MKTIATYCLCLLILLAPGCAGLGMTSQQRESARISLANEYAAGRLTEAQYTAAIEVLDKPEFSAEDWTNLLLTGGSIIASVLTGVPIAVGLAVSRVQKVRGPVATPDERVERLTKAAAAGA